MLDRIGNCRIVEEVASGGMAVVYKAVQESLGRIVAVKALKSAVQSQSNFAVRFEREACSLAALQHENIVHVYDFYRERGALFIVMEYVDGIDLFDLIDKCGQLPTDVAAIIAMQVARGLDYAHYRGIIHRDVKPANIMIARQGGVKLMDFGIARDPSYDDLTETGTGLGTPSYMSPEQVLGDKLDFRSDLFALGVVLYQMCTGRKPFIEDEQRSVMHKIRLEKFPDPRKLNPLLPRELVKIMERCMEKLPRQRWRSTQELVHALERFLARRVEMNYHARLVLFLRDRQMITPGEAEQYLTPPGTIGLRASTVASDGLVWRVAKVQGGILAGMTLATLLIHLAPIGDRAGTAFAALPATEVGPPAPTQGALKILVSPWAAVYVDGSYVDTTPFARPLLLAAGRHTLTFQNEFYPPKSRVVDVAAGSEQTLQVVLGAASDPAGPPPGAGPPAPAPPGARP